MTVYAHINTVPNGSTGSIMMREHHELLAAGNDSYVFWGRGRDAENDHECKFASDIGVKIDALRTRLDGRAGFHSGRATKRLLAHLDRINPDAVHLHNLHGYYLNIGMLFDWLARHDCMVEWTLHDCWAFTGHCAHFTYISCSQWQSHCAHTEPCPQLNTYPKTVCKSSCAKNFEDKKRLFTRISTERMTLITPSHWLEGLVKKSYLAQYPVVVKHNEIDRTVFKPTPSDFKERVGIGGRFMILGVASPWTERKGLGDFIRLYSELDPERFAIVLVGLSKRQIDELPAGVIGIMRTDSQQELAEIYTAADLFFNPTYEDNYPTVNLEAEACETPVITYDAGGCCETIQLRGSGVINGYRSARMAIEDRQRKVR